MLIVAYVIPIFSTQSISGDLELKITLKKFQLITANTSSIFGEFPGENR